MMEKSDYQPEGERIICQVRFEVLDIPGFLKELRRVGKKYQCSIICFNREAMAGRRHVTSALWHAERSFLSGEGISRSLEVESLLYAAGTRQTGLIGSFGIHEGINECYLSIVPDHAEAYDDLTSLMEENGDEDWEIISPQKEERLIEFFGITDLEICVVGRERVVDLVLERVALLTVNR
ncbi:MAG TPA: KEOPS complex subunit Cgi121 [Methanospirillum sp.]|nr:KEOPS complex subunit Cgi121 [Methanospirillum sp.]